MKKKRLGKKLDLGKKQISNLGDKTGGAVAASHISCTVGGGICTSLFVKTCTWHSELYTACNCETRDFVCPDSRLVCEA